MRVLVSVGSQLPKTHTFWLYIKPIVRVQTVLMWLIGRLVWQSDEFMVPRGQFPTCDPSLGN